MGFGGSDVSIPAFKSIDIGSLIQQAQQAAHANALNGLAIQNEIFPGLTSLENNTYATANSNLSNPVTFNPVSMPGNAGSPLLNAAYGAAANGVANLGQLPDSVRNTVSQYGAEAAGQNGFRGQGLSNIVAEDLGQTSYGLGQQQLNTAASLGQVQQGQNNSQQQLQAAIDQFNSQFGAQVKSQNNAQALQALGIVSGIGLPQSGLDPGQIASASIANVNAQNQYNQLLAGIQNQQNQNNSDFGSGVGGLVGGIAGSFFGPLGTAAGSALGSYVGRSI